MVAVLESRLRTVEGAAADVRGRHDELSQATAQIQAAELRAASEAHTMQAHAHQEAMAARQLKDEMRHVQTATDQLRGSLNLMESQAQLGESDREAVRAQRLALDNEAVQMKGVLAIREQQLTKVRQSFAESEARNKTAA